MTEYSGTHVLQLAPGCVATDPYNAVDDRTQLFVTYHDQFNNMMSFYEVRT